MSPFYEAFTMCTEFQETLARRPDGIARPVNEVAWPDENAQPPDEIARLNGIAHRPDAIARRPGDIVRRPPAGNLGTLRRRAMRSQYRHRIGALAG
nr:hypothetical protein [uncultured Actinoplanes sp.]